MPNTRPRIVFDHDGVCNACLHSKEKDFIDWNKRKKEFLELIDEIKVKIDELDQGSGVLVLSDLYGSTPSNIATQFHAPNKVSVVLGVNLPMLIRVFNYPKDDLQKVAAKAIAGGRDGVFSYPPSIKEDGHAK